MNNPEDVPDVMDEDDPDDGLDNEEDAGDIVTEFDDPIPLALPIAPPGGLYGEIESAEEESE